MSVSVGDRQRGEAADGAVEDDERRTDSNRVRQSGPLATERTLSLPTTKSFCSQ